MARNKIPVTKQQGTLGGQPLNEDKIIALIANGVAVSGTLVLNTVYKCRSLRDVTALGITAAYDTTNVVLLYRRIKRIYLRNPKAELHLMVVDQARTLTQMVDLSYTTTFGKNLLKGADGRVKYLGICRNPATYAPTLTDGLDADVLTAIPKAQELYNSEAAEFRYAQIVIEGRNFNGTVGDAKNLRGMSADYPNVSVCINSDPALATANTLFNYYAGVEDVLALKTIGAISQNIGENNKALYNLQDVANDFYSGATQLNQCVGLSSNLKLSSYVEQDLETLNEKGYIFAEPVSGLAGIYFNDTHTCVTITSDYSYIENNAVIDKAIRLCRIALLPVVNARLYADVSTGQLTSTEEKGLINIAVKSIEPLEKDGDISGGIDAAICPDNPEYDLLGGDDLDVVVSFVPVIIGRKINLTIGFRNPKKTN